MAALVDLAINLWLQLFFGFVPERPRWLRVLVQTLYVLLALALVLIAGFSLVLLLRSVL